MLGLQRLIEGQTLDIPELVKERTPNRADVLADKIENEEPITLINGLTATLDAKQNAHLAKLLRTHDGKAFEATFLKGRKYIPVFADKQGNMYALNHFAKTAEFGGGAQGAGGGKIIEARSEIGQALALGMTTVLGKDLTPTDFTAQNLAASAQYVVPNVEQQQIEEVLQMIAADKFWARSFSQVANALTSKLSLNNKMFHRDSQWTVDLHDVWRLAVSEMDPKPFSSNIAKWNPSDIWAVSQGIEVPEPGTSLEELNAWLLEQYHRSKVYGISLKKTGPTAQITVHNLDPKGDQLKITMRDLIVTKAHRLEALFSAADTYISYEAIQMPLSMYYLLSEATPQAAKDFVQFRSFGTGIQGEIKGRQARHGKVGFGSINAVLRSLTGQAVTDYKEVRSYVQNPKKRKELINDLILMAEEVMGQSVTPTIKRKLTAQAGQAGEAKLIAKFQAVQLLYHVHNFRKRNKKKADQFLTMLFQYASSQTPLSSVFVKVS